MLTYRKQIDQLIAKRDRQLQAAADTQDMIDALEILAAQTKAAKK